MLSIDNRCVPCLIKYSDRNKLVFMNAKTAYDAYLYINIIIDKLAC